VRKLKKFKRFEKGGLTDSSGNPVLSGDGTPIQTTEDTETPDEKYAKRREGYESVKDFFMGRRSKDEPSAPIEERKPPKKAAEEDKAPTRAAVKSAEPAETKPVESGKITSTSTMTEEEKRADSDKGAAPSSSTTTGNAKKAEAYRQSLMPVNKPKPKPPALAPAPAPAPAPAASAKAPIAASPNQIPGTDVKTPYKGETIDNSNLAAKQLAQSTLGATAAGRTLGAGARGAMGLGRMFESLSKPAPKEAPRTEPKLDSKPAPSSGAIQPTGKGPSEAGKALMERTGQGKPASAPTSKPAPKRETVKERTQREINRQRELDNDRRGSTGLSPMGKRAQELIKKQREADKYSGDAGVDKVLAKHDLPRKKGGKIPAFKKGGLVGRADGCAQRGKTKGRMV